MFQKRILLNGARACWKKGGKASIKGSGRGSLQSAEGEGNRWVKVRRCW